MTDTAGPFDGKPWAEAQWARHAAQWAPSGVYGSPAASTTTGDLPLSVSGLSVGLGAGRAWVRGFGFERTGAAVMQVVSANTHASFSRRDRMVLRRDLATHTITPVLLTGTPASSPAAPAVTQSEAGSWDLPLFSFLVPPNSGTSITGVVDERARVDSSWQELTDGTGYSFGLSNTIQQVPFPGGGTSKTHTVPAGRQLECEFVIPRLTVPSSGTVQFNLQDGGAVLDGGEVSTSGTLWTPLRLRGHVTGDGLPHTIAVQAWQGGGSGAGISGSPPTGAGVKYRWRLI